MKEPKWICVTGADGAGKSSLIELLLKDKQLFEGKKVKEVTIWDLFNLPLEQQRIFIKSKKDVDLYLKSLSPQSRTFFLLHCFAQAIEIARKEEVDIALINAYWYKYMAMEVAYDNDLEGRLLLTKNFPQPDKVFVLQVSVDTASKRKQYYSGFESGFPDKMSAAAFSDFQMKVQAAFRQIISKVEHVALDGELPLETLKEQIIGGL